MTDWASLRHAYGSAERVPKLLRAAERSGTDFDEAWDDLWSHLCHQGTVYSASYAAIPFLTEMCLRQEPRGYMTGLQLVGSILASNDGPEDPAAIRKRYGSEIGSLRGVAERCVSLADDDTEFIYAVETLMAFENGGVWQRTLTYLANGEAPLDCVRCADQLLIHVEEPPATVTAWDAPAEPTPVMAVEPAPGSTEARLLALATEYERPQVASKLSYFFGTATCPTCGADFAVPAAFAM